MSIGVYNSAGELVDQILVEQTNQPMDSFTLSNNGAVTSLNGLDNAVTIDGVNGPITVWNGTNANGTPVSNGTYYIKIDNVDPTGNVKTITQAVNVNRTLEQVTVKIYNEAGEVVRTLYSFMDDPGNNLLSNAQLSSNAIQPGSSTNGNLGILLSNGVTMSWDGRDDSGQVVTEGQYFVEIHATDGKGGETVITHQVTVLGDRGAGPLVWAYPNVTDGSIPVTFSVNAPTPQDLSVRAYTTAGELVKVALTPAGGSNPSQTVWNVQGLASGLYIALLEAKDMATGNLTVRKTIKVVIRH